MEKIVQYFVVTGKLDEVVTKVNDMIAENCGWEPFGGLVVRPSPEGAVYHQPMVRKFWDKTSPEFR